MKIEHFTATSPKGEIDLYKLTNDNGASVTLSSLGAGIVSVIVPDAKGVMDDVVLGYSNAADYFYDGPCAGKVPGRYANRIAKGLFSIGDKNYSLAINNGPNALHGGPEGFQNQIWKSKIVGDNTIVFTYHSVDGEEGYPANADIEASYTWTEDNKLILKLSATSDGDTIVNLTNHAYWNLDGHNSGDILNHELWLACSNYLPTDDSLIPTGEIATVEGTPMDFTEPKLIGRDIKNDFPALNYGKGYDNCWMVDDWKPGVIREVARLSSDKSGRILTVSTTQPAAQVYTGNWLAGSPINKSGRSYNDYDGVAIECQHTPDAPNHPQFPSTLLHKGERMSEEIVFSFSTK